MHSPCTRRVVCALGWDADWCLQSDLMPDSRLQVNVAGSVKKSQQRQKSLVHARRQTMSLETVMQGKLTIGLPNKSKGKTLYAKFFSSNGYPENGTYLVLPMHVWYPENGTYFYSTYYTTLDLVDDDSASVLDSEQTLGITCRAGIPTLLLPLSPPPSRPPRPPLLQEADYKLVFLAPNLVVDILTSHPPLQRTRGTPQFY